METAMDRSIAKLPDPIAESSHGERRRSVRQKLHTPVYATFNGLETGTVVDLSELLDLHQDGFAVQTSAPLEVNRPITLCLDLPQTKSYIHGSGQVVWSDDAGRGGVRFSSLSEGSDKILKEWLFDNLLIASYNHASRTEQKARHAEEKPAEEKKLGEEKKEETLAVETREEKPAEPALASESSTVVSIADRSPASDPVEAVRAEVGEIADDADSVLQLIAERALKLTESSGAALAFFTADKMICRVRSGEPAPPLGATLDTRQGLSGECVRSGRLVSCEDAGNDPRVDPEVCRALGIGALMAAPIVADFQVVGVLEVFSPQPRAFTSAQRRTLDQLAEMVPKASAKASAKSAYPENAPLDTPITPDDERVPARPSASYQHSIQSGLVESSVVPASMSGSGSGSALMSAINQALRDRKNEVPEQPPQPEPVQEQDTAPAAASSRLLYRTLLGLALAVVVTALGYVAGPSVKNWAKSLRGTQQSSLHDTLQDTTQAIDVAEAASAAHGQNAAGIGSGSVDSGSADHVAQPKSLSDLRKLADAGDADAQWQMGVRYHDGEGVPEDDAQAVRWFQRAAEQGNVAAQGALGAYYWRGRGVSADLSKAYFWSRIAMAQGDEISKSRIEGLSSQMTREQVDAARQQAEVWIRGHSQSVTKQPQSKPN